MKPLFYSLVTVFLPFLCSAQFFESKIGAAINVDQFRSVDGIAIDASGNVYVIDRDSRLIKKFSNNGNPVLQWGSYGSADGQFIYPQGIAVDATGNVYVSDASMSRIQKFNSSGEFVSKFGSYGNGDGQFNSPRGICFDASGNIFVVDVGNHRIQKFSSTGTFIAKWGGQGSSAGNFSSPQDIAVDANGNVYVVDMNNFRIQKFTNGGAFSTLWGSAGSSDGQFTGAQGIALDATGNIFVVEANNHRFQKFNNVTAFVSKTGVFGSGNGQFNSPRGIALDASGNIYVADSGNRRIQKFNSAGTFLLTFGTLAQGNGQFNYPQGVAADSNGNIFVVDTNNNRIQKFNSGGVYISTWGSFGSGDGQFSYPSRIAVDASNNVYVLDLSNNRIQKFTNTGVFISKFGTLGSGNGQLSSPRGFTLDAAGNIYIADTNNHRIQKFSNAGVYIAQWGANGSGDGLFSSPYGVAVDVNNDVYVLDYGNNRIQKFNSSGSFISKWGTLGSGNGQIWYAQSIETSPDGSVVISDTGNARVQIFSGDGTVLGKWGSSGGADGQFLSPMGIYIDNNGFCYIADNGNHRIQKFSILSIKTISTASGAVGSTVTITGSGFSTVASENLVKFNNTVATISSATSTSLTLTVPAGATTGKISIARGGFNVSSLNEFLVLPLAINSFTPAIGVPGTSVSIVGSGFSGIATNNLVKFNGVTATVVSSTSSVIVANVPTGSTIGKVTVTVHGTTATSLTDFAGTLSLTSFTPTSGTEGSTVTISGTGFSTLPTQQIVQINGTNAEVVSGTLTTLTIKVPANTTTGKISVTREGSTVESEMEFVSLPLAITSITPSVGHVGGSVTLTGTGFSSIPANNEIKFNNVSSLATSSTPTRITVTIPNDATTGKITLSVGGVTTTSSEDFKITKLLVTQFTAGEIFKIGDAGLATSLVVNNINEVANIILKSKGLTAAETAIRSEAVSLATTNTIQYQIPASHFTDPLGISFWFIVTDKDGNEISTGNKYAHIQFPASSPKEIPDLKSGKDIKSYNLFSVPFELIDNKSASVFKVLGEYDDRKWRLYSFVNEKLIEKPGSILPGNGYWFIQANENKIILPVGSTVRSTPESLYKLNLIAGWNLIGNPYNFTISWDDVLTHQGAAASGVRGLRQYDNSTGVFKSSNILPAFAAAFVFSESALPLEVPIINKGASGGRFARDSPTPIDSKNWNVSLAINDGEFGSDLFSFGMNEKADEQFDHFDEPTLPMLLGMSSFDFRFREVDNRFLATDIVPASSNYTWKATLTAERDLTLAWDNRYFGNGEKLLVIENSNSVEVTEMNTTNKLFLPKGAHQLKFHYGDNQYIKDQLLENNVRVGAMFPNPVNRTAGDLTIAVSLPEGKNEVSMQLVNMLGNSFATSPVQTVEGGRQYITWKADLAPVASGIYLVRIGVKASMGQQRFEYRRIVIE